jgi:hypothetical protein
MTSRPPGAAGTNWTLIMDNYLLNALLNVVAETTFGHPVIGSDLPEYTPEEVRLIDIAHAMREAFRLGQLVRRN